MHPFLLRDYIAKPSVNDQNVPLILTDITRAAWKQKLSISRTTPLVILSIITGAFPALLVIGGVSGIKTHTDAVRRT
jgi:hypothetical protein